MKRPNVCLSGSKRQRLWTPDRESGRQGKPMAPPVAEKPSFNSILFGSLDKVGCIIHSAKTFSNIINPKQIIKKSSNCIYNDNEIFKRLRSFLKVFIIILF